MAGERVLIVEDDGLLRSVVAERLRHDGLDVTAAANLAEARQALDAQLPDVAMLDMRLPDGEGLSLLRELPATPGGAGAGTAWVVMTAHATVSLAVEALKLGARDFLEKPFSLDRAVATVRQALEWSALRREVATLREKSSIAGTTVIGESPAMQRAFDLVRRLAEAGSSTVLIEGESGSGKGAIAQALHRLSPRASGPFLNVTCSALPETLMESELFGHEKGAFTDAHSAKRGLVEMAHGGTLFLDEIAELTPGVQAKLLRFIEDKAFRRLGGTKDLTVDVRIMAATNRALADEVAAGRFRADLFYRLHVVPVTLPPLRHRKEDIAPLAAHFLEFFTREFGKRVCGFDPGATEVLEAYRWPGNVRELRNVIERAVLLADGETIGVRDLPAEVTRQDAPVTVAAGSLPEMERQLLSDALAREDGNQSRAAKQLGISRHQLRTRMKRWGMLAVSALLLMAPRALRAQTAAERAQSARCELCHANAEVLARRAPQGWHADSLLVSAEALSRSAHATVPCVRCHPLPGVADHPDQARATVPCGTCHSQADSLWRSGPHGRGKVGHPAAPNAPCTACHGVHTIQPARTLTDSAGLRALTARCVGCHQDRVFKPGDVHKDKVSCASCHGSHMIQPVRDPATHGVPIAIAERCAACHADQAALARTDIHGVTAREQASGRRPITRDTAATCVACHGGHGIQPARSLSREVALVNLCGRCHAGERESYGDTYHGRANRLGYTKAARCDDCHSGHRVFPSSDARAQTNPANLAHTCGKCHEAAKRPAFLQYHPHVQPHSPKEGLPIFGTWLFMNVLLGSVFTVFGMHTLFWLKRLVELKWKERQRRIALGLPPVRQKVPLDSAERGEGPFVWRFKLSHRLVHGVSVVSFFALIITGVPLRFSCAAWAPGLMRLLGGTGTAGIIHRVAGGITVAYFTFHVVQMVVMFFRTRDKKSLFRGPDSMVPQPRDLRDFIQMWKWFFGKAEFPRFPRYGYNEKFHYLGAFWGIVLLGATGLVRWFPSAATAVLPGWMFNVAAIVHSDEALLAAGFMFIIHFFNVHMRPDKFPMDGVMFTGRVRLEELAKDHAETAAAIGRLDGVPVSAVAIPDLPAPPPPRWMSVVAAIGGLLALSVGLALVAMVMWVQLC